MKPFFKIWRYLEPPMAPDVRYNFRVDAISSLAYGVFWGLYNPFLQVIARRLGADATMLSWIVAAVYIGNMSTVISARIFTGGTKLPRMIWCWRISRGLFFLMPFILQSWQLLILVMVFWIFESLPQPPYAAYMRQIYPDAIRGKAMSAVRLGMALILLIVTPLGGWLLDQVGYQALFPAAALFGILSAEAFGHLDASPSPHEETPGSHWGLLTILGKDRRFVLYLIGLNLWGIGNTMPTPLFPLIQVDRLHLNYSVIGILAFLQSVTWVVSLLFFGRLLDHFGPLWTLRFTFGMSVLVLGSYLLAYQPSILVVGFLASGIVWAGFDLSNINAVVKLAPAGHIPDYMSALIVISGIRGLFAPFLGAWLAQTGPIGISGVLVLGIALISSGIGLSLLINTSSMGIASNPAEAGSLR